MTVARHLVVQGAARRLGAAALSLRRRSGGARTPMCEGFPQSMTQTRVNSELQTALALLLYLFAAFPEACACRRGSGFISFALSRRPSGSLRWTRPALRRQRACLCSWVRCQRGRRRPTQPSSPSGQCHRHSTVSSRLFAHHLCVHACQGRVILCRNPGMILVVSGCLVCPRLPVL